MGGLTVAAFASLVDWLDHEREARGLSDREFEALTGYSRRRGDEAEQVIVGEHQYTSASSSSHRGRSE